MDYIFKDNYEARPFILYLWSQFKLIFDMNGKLVLVTSAKIS